MKPIALIPARAGSKRLPLKNRQMIGGKTLVEIAAQQALESGLFSAIIVSTNDEWFFTEQTDMLGYVDLAQRPEELSQDGTEMMDVVRYAANMASTNHPPTEFDSIVLLQPTSPMRLASDIRAAYELFVERRAEAVISVVETRQPEVFTQGHAGRLRPITIHVDGRRLLVPNGAIYILRREAMERGLDWWSAPVTYGYEMPPERSLDIDTVVDLMKAREAYDELTGQSRS